MSETPDELMGILYSFEMNQDHPEEAHAKIMEWHKAKVKKLKSALVAISKVTAYHDIPFQEGHRPTLEAEMAKQALKESEER